jgi:hypothetical protein
MDLEVLFHHDPDLAEFMKLACALDHFITAFILSLYGEEAGYSNFTQSTASQRGHTNRNRFGSKPFA